MIGAIVFIGAALLASPSAHKSSAQASSASASTQAPTQASAAFTVIASDGQVQTGSALLAGERKVVLYISPDLEPAARLLDAFKGWTGGDERWRGRVVVIVAGAWKDAGQWLTQRWGEGELPAWAADPDLQGWRALGFQGTIGVAGVEKGAIDWKLDGVIADPSIVEPSIRAWTGIEGQ
jgi:hypothetical protein